MFSVLCAVNTVHCTAQADLAAVRCPEPGHQPLDPRALPLDDVQEELLQLLVGDVGGEEVREAA